jgi:hypothetical protein
MLLVIRVNSVVVPHKGPIDPAVAGGGGVAEEMLLEGWEWEGGRVGCRKLWDGGGGGDVGDGKLLGVAGANITEVDSVADPSGKGLEETHGALESRRERGRSKRLKVEGTEDAAASARTEAGFML